MKKILIVIGVTVTALAIVGYFVFKFINRGSLLINVSPQNVKVLIDGSEHSVENSLELKLSVGEHIIEVEKTNYHPDYLFVNIARGETAVVDFNLDEKTLKEIYEEAVLEKYPESASNSGDYSIENPKYFAGGTWVVAEVVYPPELQLNGAFIVMSKNQDDVWSLVYESSGASGDLQELEAPLDVYNYLQTL